MGNQKTNVSNLPDVYMSAILDIQNGRHEKKCFPNISTYRWHRVLTLTLKPTFSGTWNPIEPSGPTMRYEQR